MAKFRQDDLTWFKIRSQVSKGELEADILENSSESNNLFVELNI